MTSCVRNICAKNYQNLLIGFQVTVENVGDVFLGHSVDAYRAACVCQHIPAFHGHRPGPAWIRQTVPTRSASSAPTYHQPTGVQGINTEYLN